MKTFEDVEKGIVTVLSDRIKETTQKINSGKLDSGAIYWSNDFCKRWVSGIENSEESTKIEIGKDTNDIIEEMYFLRDRYLREYYENFDSLIREKMFALDDSMRPIEYNQWFTNRIGRVHSQICRLGIKFEDLLCFKGRANLSEAGDLFRDSVNRNFGTTIPMAGELEAVEQAYREADIGSYEEAEAYVKYCEMKRDTGLMVQSAVDFYDTLNSDQQYLDAKELCGSRSR